jgi:hypothetical protein
MSVYDVTLKYADIFNKYTDLSLYWWAFLWNWTGTTASFEFTSTCNKVPHFLHFSQSSSIKQHRKLHGLSLRASNLRLSAKLVPTSVDRGCHVVSVTDPYSRNLRFLDQSCYSLFQVAPQLYSQGWVDPVPDPLLLRKSGRARNRTRTSGSVARNSDY